jgi:hypothetical protein
MNVDTVVVCLLLARGARVDHRNKHGVMLYMLAAPQYTEIVAALACWVASQNADLRDVVLHAPRRTTLCATRAARVR